MLTATPAENAASTGLIASLYRGPERRHGAVRARHWLAATLDEIDYGMLLLVDEVVATHVNHAAHAELDATHPLELAGGRLRARRPQDAAALSAALQAAARRGLRKLLTLGDAAQRVSISIVPLSLHDPASGPVTLVMLGKRQVCEVLSVQGFAQGQGLSAAEARVLAALCRGTPPTEIAVQLGVAISTVRTQIGNIRLKTGAPSIRALVQQVAALPPLMGVLRSATTAAGAAG